MQRGACSLASDGYFPAPDERIPTMTARFVKLAAAALLSLAAVPALADGEGSFQPAQVASQAVAQKGVAYAPYAFATTPTPGSTAKAQPASPASGRVRNPIAAVPAYNVGLNG